MIVLGGLLLGVRLVTAAVLKDGASRHADDHLVKAEHVRSGDELLTTSPPTRARYVPGRILLQLRTEEEVEQLLVGGQQRLRVGGHARSHRLQWLERLEAQSQIHGITHLKPIFHLAEPHGGGGRSRATPAGVRGIIQAELPSRRLQRRALLEQVVARKLRRPGGPPISTVSAGIPRALRSKIEAFYEGRVPDHTDPEALCEELLQNPFVAACQPDFVVRVLSDPFLGSSGTWGQPYDDLWGIKRVRAPEAWQRGVHGAGVVVAVIDTGVDYLHPELRPNMWVNPGEDLNRNGFIDGVNLCPSRISGDYNCLDDDGNGMVDDLRGFDFANSLDGNADGDFTDVEDTSDTDPMDDHGHGTHVAGTIAAAENGLGVVGVAPEAKILPVKGLDQEGSGFSSDLAKALVYAAQYADVMNNSWGCIYDCPSNPVIEAAVQEAHQRHTTVVFAAGNSNADTARFSPQNQPQTITVASLDHLDQRSDFSNYGLWLGVAAPGGESGAPCQDPMAQSILSVRASGTDMYAACGDDWVGRMVVQDQSYRARGTSMATPHVAGAAALWLSAHRDDPSGLAFEQVRQALRRGSADLAEPGFDLTTGFGRLDALGALAVEEPLAALVLEPAGSIEGQQTIPLSGLAGGAGLSSWLVGYGRGHLPDGVEAVRWEPLADGTSTVNGELLQWDITGIPDGPYTIRMVAGRANGDRFEHRSYITIDQVIMTSPSPRELTTLRGSVPVEIRGTVAPADLRSFTIAVRGSAGPLLDAKISVTGDGLVKVRNGVLGVWGSAGIEPDLYTIDLIVTLTSGQQVTETAQVIVDPTLHEGFPKRVGLLRTGIFSLAVTEHLNVVDVTGDGFQEILVGYGDAVRIFDHSGQELEGWPQSVDPDGLGAIIQQSPAVGDLNGDGRPEVVATNSKGQVFVWHADGQPLAGWNRHFGGMGRYLVAIDDLDCDGTVEVIATDSSSRNVMVLGPNGQPNWRRLVGTVSYGHGAPAVGDIDHDGCYKEVVIASRTERAEVCVLAHDGRLQWCHILEPGGRENFGLDGTAVLADLDGDQDLEIVVTGAAGGYVYALHHDGRLVDGWPQQVHHPDGAVEWANPAAVGDMDGDELPEIVVGHNTETQALNDILLLHGWHGDGTPISEVWPIPIRRTERFWVYGPSVDAPILADVDGNGLAEVVVATDHLHRPLQAYRADGTSVEGFPKLAEDTGSPDVTPAVADLDQDGLLELAWIDANATLYVWDLVAEAVPNYPWPMYRYSERHPAMTPLADNRLPVLTIAGTTSVDEGGLLTVEVSVSDPDGDPVTVTLEEATGRSPDELGLRFVQRAEGIWDLSWTPTFDQAGTYELALRASDGRGFRREPLTIEVRQVNRPPQAPALLTVTVLQGQQVRLTIPASDPDGDALRYLVRGLPLGASFDGMTGTLDWTPGYDTPGGVYHVTVGVQDPWGSQATVEIRIEVVVVFLRGDANGSGALDLSDAIRIFEALFLRSDVDPQRDAFDANDSGRVDVSDGIYVLQFLFTGGRPPPAPFPVPGPDPTPDGLS